MNMQALMAQAKKMQANLEKITKEISEKEFEYNTDNICVVMNGDYIMKSVQIKNDILLSDKELLEDIITVAVNDLTNKIKTEKEEKLGKYTNGLGGLF